MGKKYFFIMEQLKKFRKPFEIIVNGTSMEPTIKCGETVKVVPCDKKDLKIGDIIVYQKFNNHLTVHRIVKIIKIDEEHFWCKTKGDNNAKMDHYQVLDKEIIGVVDENWRDVRDDEVHTLGYNQKL